MLHTLPNTPPLANLVVAADVQADQIQDVQELIGTGGRLVVSTTPDVVFVGRAAASGIAVTRPRIQETMDGMVAGDGSIVLVAPQSIKATGRHDQKILPEVEFEDLKFDLLNPGVRGAGITSLKALLAGEDDVVFGTDAEERLHRLTPTMRLVASVALTATGIELEHPLEITPDVREVAQRELIQRVMEYVLHQPTKAELDGEKETRQPDPMVIRAYVAALQIDEETLRAGTFAAIDLFVPADDAEAVLFSRAPHVWESLANQVFRPAQAAATA